MSKYINYFLTLECPSEPDDIIGNYTGLQGGGTYATVTKKENIGTDKLIFHKIFTKVKLSLKKKTSFKFF